MIITLEGLVFRSLIYERKVTIHREKNVKNWWRILFLPSIAPPILPLPSTPPLLSSFRNPIDTLSERQNNLDLCEKRHSKYVITNRDRSNSFIYELFLMAFIRMTQR